MAETTKGKPVQQKVLSYRSSILFLVIGILILSGVGYWLVLQSSNITNQIQSQRTRLEALNQREAGYQQLEDDYESIKDQYPVIDKALPDQNNFVDSIVFLEDLAKKKNVDLEITFPDQPMVENSLLGYGIKIIGDQPNVLKYLVGLKDTIYYFEFSTLELRKSGPGQAIVVETTINIGVDETFQPSQISN